MTRVVASLVLVAMLAGQIQGQGILGYLSNSFSLLRPDSLETPEFKELRNATAKDPESFEERVYQAAKWACISETVNNTEAPSTRTMFLDLFRYFSGDNDEKKEFDLTIPVSTKVSPKAGTNETTYQTCLQLPAKIQSAVPKPNNAKITIEDRPEFTVFTRRQGGYLVSENGWKDEAKALQKILEDKQQEADFSYYFRNSYNTPFRVFNRRNEVWYVKSSGSSEAAAPVEDEKKVADEKKPAEDEKKPVEDEKKPVEEKKKVEEKKADEKKKVEEKKTEEKKVVEEKKKVDEKKADEKKAEEKKPDEKKVEEKKADEKKAEETKADDKKPAEVAATNRE